MHSVILILLSLACCALFIFMAACAYRLLSRWLRTPWMLRRLPSGPYHCHYACERDVMADSRARHMALICHYGYTNKQLAAYYENLTIASLPMEKLLGWTRTIAEDLLDHPSPILRVDYWSDYIARLSGRLVVVHPHVDEFQPWEASYLWGAVYYWLRRFAASELPAGLLEHIAEMACPRSFTQPYFDYFVQMAKLNADERAASKSPVVNINIGQMALENKGVMANIEKTS